MYGGITSPLSYILGVNAGILYYNTPLSGYHNFYSNGTSTTPILSLSTTTTTINNATTINCDINITANTYIKLLQSYEIYGSSLYYGQIYLNAGVYIMKAINNPTGIATSIQFNTCNASNIEAVTMVLNLVLFS